MTKSVDKKAVTASEISELDIQDRFRFYDDRLPKDLGRTTTLGISPRCKEKDGSFSVDNFVNDWSTPVMQRDSETMGRLKKYVLDKLKIDQ